MRIKFLIGIILLSLFVGCGGSNSDSTSTTQIEDNPYSTLIDANESNTSLIPPPLP